MLPRRITTNMVIDPTVMLSPSGAARPLGSCRMLVVACIAATLGQVPTGASARAHPTFARPAPHFSAPPASIPPYSAFVVDAATGKVLADTAADEPRHPASLTKMMTLYMVFEALRDRRITLDQPVPVSVHAASVEPSKLGLTPGSRMTVEQGILGLVTKSANDAASALGELLGGDEDRFAQMMTLRARALGMAGTTFRNASGLPDPAQFSTARDLALLATRLVRDFPGEYRYFSVPSFVFHGQTVYNHDRMLLTYPGADGLKTGYTEASGHNLVTSAVHGPVRLVGVVLGAGSNAARDMEMASLLNAAFVEQNAPDIGPDRTASVRMAQLHPARAPNLRLASLITEADAATLPASLRARRHPLAATNAISPAAALQLGSYATRAAAQRAAAAARHNAARSVRVISATARGKTVWRVLAST